MTAVAARDRVLRETPPVERQVAFDMIRRAVPVLPVALGVAWLVRGTDGALSASFAILLVLANFALAAVMLTAAARVSLAALMGTALFGYLLRLALITVAVLLVKDMAWVDIPTLGLTIVVTHLGLLIWETRYVSASLAYPALKPRRRP